MDSRRILWLGFWQSLPRVIGDFQVSPQEQYKVLLDYLLMKVDKKDWHGVADAAMDMRELLAQHPDADK